MVKYSKEDLTKLAAVSGRRARVVVDHIMAHGSITTDELKETYGYDHPPRAIGDVKDQGIPVVTTMFTTKDGRKMARYSFGDLSAAGTGRLAGREQFSKEFKLALLAAYGSKCGVCSAALEARYLQIDHRVPFRVAGDVTGAALDVKDFMLLCAPCNRAKS